MEVYCILLGPCMLVLDVLGEELVEKVVSSCYDMLACYLPLLTENNCILRMSLSNNGIHVRERPWGVYTLTAV